ncbi:fasciclin domain-containing protein [Sphingobacterium pedocola]|uniref:FAS1 domain-containing protein n=1 Tax=Sphingobacterium pedocola TaxID=2082722 RepID=A0ABR9TB95_9SPHI|nr:fasciclin domain-containing protein [Sphingobacterium pedocola]MBE8722625.1 hypothetical protein [Sphingobacterium pedocola]
MKLFLSLCCCIGILLSGCDDAYYNDGGLLDEQTGVHEGTTMSYLESQPALFDTLTTLIKLNKLEELVNRKGSTFFAPQNYSIYNYLLLKYPDPENRPKTLEAIPAEDMAEMAGYIADYIIPNEQIMRSKLSTVYSYSTAMSGKKARFNLVREDYLGNVNMGAAYIIYSVNLNPPATLEFYSPAKVVVTDVATTTGTVHVLVADTHVFGFN